MKKKIPVIFPVILIPLLIVMSAFVLDIASVRLLSFLVYSAIIYAVFLVSYGAFNRIWVSWLITSVPVYLLEVINFYKMRINGTPLLLSDLSFFGSAHKIIGFALPQIKLSAMVICGGIFFVALSVALIIIEPIFKKGKKSRFIMLGTGCIIAILLSIPGIHRFIAQKGDCETLSPQHLIVRHGVVAGLYVSSVSANDTLEIDLTREDIKAVINKTEPAVLKSEKLPTVIFLMSESFFDVDRLPNISFSEDPIPTFHSLKENYSSGKFISNTYCGGTGYVELEFLTGLCSRFLDAMHTLDALPDSTAYVSVPCIGDIFKSHGYKTSFVHSYDTTLYNRPFIYNAFLFDEILFDSDFTVPVEKSGGFISDMTLTEQIISMYESSGDAPSMIYAISMENHQPYLADKFDEKSGITMECNLLQEDKDMFEAYIHGLNNADKALNELIGYFSNVEEPVIIAFWGDHLPNLGTSDGSNIYTSLGYCADEAAFSLTGEDYLNMLTTDYIIWDNFGLEKEDKDIGCAMFGLELCERMGIELNDYFKWLSATVKDNYLVYSSAIFAASTDKVYSYIPEEYAEMLDNYHQVVYDIAYGEHKLFGRQR